MKKRILFIDLDAAELRPLSRFRSVFSLRNGILTPLERIRLKYTDADLYFRHPNQDYEEAMAQVESLIPQPSGNGRTPLIFPGESETVHESGTYDEVVRSDSVDLFYVLDRLAERIRQDIILLKLDRPEFRPADISCHLVGSREDLFVHPSATILPGSVLDTREGPVIIDEGAIITPFSYLEGPVYVGRNARVDNARLTGGCILGWESRVGGEIENSIVGDFSNKHHEGFLGHSVLGRWVNLGALTTTSDLKNNYGEIRLKMPTPFIPRSGISYYNTAVEDTLNLSTGRIKFGSVIGDCVKVSIGTMLITGTVIDCGCNIFGGTPPKYVPPLSWGLTGEKYAVERFLADCEKIFARRGQKPHPNLGTLCFRLVGREAKPRQTKGDM